MKYSDRPKPPADYKTILKEIEECQLSNDQFKELCDCLRAQAQAREIWRFENKARQLDPYTEAPY